ncbi:hypothetical protein LWI29_019496 [Acer saccharum]|uniref:Annexin n=1 Tax=Acer saccharum TaxID=4024 RepID=A0AA39RKE6_ACESA|nr:hypothetical protein LWI29_019496 [Acer saccharum]
MADGFDALIKAFSGIGIDEKAIISLLGESHPEHRQNFRKGCRDFFIEDERSFERWDDHRVKLLKHEFMRFKNAVVLSSDELLGARKAYHSLFDHSIEEDVASHVDSSERKLLLALVSAYRYEGPKVKDDTAKSDAKKLAHAIKNADKKNLVEDEEIISILSTRSKLHLKAVYKHYKEICGKNIDEDLTADPILLAAVHCLCIPQTYFCMVLDASLTHNADKKVKKGLTRVIVTQADRNMKEIKEEYQKLYGVSLSQKIEVTAKGNYRDLLLTLLARGN